MRNNYWTLRGCQTKTFLESSFQLRHFSFFHLIHPLNFLFFNVSHFYPTLPILAECHPILLSASSCISSLPGLHHHQINLSAYFPRTFCPQSPQVLRIPPHIFLQADWKALSFPSDSSCATANHSAQPSSSQHASFPPWIFLRTTRSQRFYKEWLTRTQNPPLFHWEALAFSRLSLGQGLFSPHPQAVSV